MDRRQHFQDCSLPGCSLLESKEGYSRSHRIAVAFYSHRQTHKFSLKKEALFQRREGLFSSKNNSIRSASTVLILSSSPSTSALSSVASIAASNLSRAQMLEQPIFARIKDSIPVPQPRSIALIVYLSSLLLPKFISRTARLNGLRNSCLVGVHTPQRE